MLPLPGDAEEVVLHHPYELMTDPIQVSLQSNGAGAGPSCMGDGMPAAHHAKG